MLFNSLEFLIFFPLTTVLYFLLPHKWRCLLLLGASCIFYMAWVPVYILVLFLIIVIDYFAAQFIEKAEGKARKGWLAVSICANVSVLAVFKYYNFFNENMAALCQMAGIAYLIPSLSIILPIGLSFHTFQAMSYTIEVYRGKQAAEKNPFIYALYVMFYPQLVAGPIERPQQLLHQFYLEHKFDCDRVVSGLQQMVWGFFKKVVIADRLSVLVNQVYAQPTQFPGIALILATYFFSFQIFCDFSGYSDIAIGAARVMGFNLMRNFDRPYWSKSIGEFWQRWHISLSTWFRDYLYIPLGGNRVSKGRWYLNLFIVFVVSGFWHGANWTFIVWGALHGAYMILCILTERLRDAFCHVTGLSRLHHLKTALSILITFNFATFAWIFFRARNMSDACYIVTHLFAGGSLSDVFALALGRFELAVAFVSILIMEVGHFIQGRRHVGQMIAGWPLSVRWPFYYTALTIIVMFGKFDCQEFIYFQF